MTDYTNSAKRLIAVLAEASKRNGDEATGKVWASVFGLPWDDYHPDPHFVQQKLAVLRGEIDYLEAQMRRTQFSQEGYVQHLGRIRRSISRGNVDAPWKSYFGELFAPDVQLALLWCSQVIPNEATVTVAELEKVLGEIKALRSSIDSLGISQAVRDFILQQLDLIEQAIQEYPIRGGAAIREGFHKAAAIYAAAEDVPFTKAEAENVGKVNRLFSRLGKATEGVIKADKLASAVLSIAEKSGRAGNAIADAIDKLPSLGP
ncbi:MAG TPA: hypothetical protein VEC99_16750 [Clostridia bacterium]|nr:hypothetical protein [Clostridia bacterium]